MATKTVKAKITLPSGTISAIVTIVLGALLALSVFNLTSLINWIIGLALIVFGVIEIILDLAAYKTITTSLAVGSVYLGLGIFLIISPIDYIKLMALVVAVAGALLLLKGIIGLIHHNSTLTIVMNFVAGAVALALSLVIMLVPAARTVCGIIVGVVLLIYGVVALINSLSRRK